MKAHEIANPRPPDARQRDAIRIAKFAYAVVKILRELERKHGISTRQLIEVGRECVIEWCKARRVSRRSSEAQFRRLEAVSNASLTRH